MALPMQTAQIGDIEVVTVIVNGEPHSASNTHPNYKAILQKAIDGDESVVDLFDVSIKVAKKFENLSERVSVHGGRVFFDGEEVDTALTRQIVKFLEIDADFSPLVNFYEKLAQNPNPHSREQLYTWLNAHDFTITPEGDLLGYKGVKKLEDGKYESVNHGRAIVNDQEYNGAIPNNIGDTVTMPRGDVEFNPGVGCSTGLHVGTWDYASGWAKGAVLEVRVNPRDVVSVPTDCGGQKLRTCRYVVTGVTDGNFGTPLKSATWGDEAYDDYDDDEYGDDEYYDDEVNTYNGHY
jgi:hypothetical protein